MPYVPYLERGNTVEIPTSSPGPRCSFKANSCIACSQHNKLSPNTHIAVIFANPLIVRYRRYVPAARTCWRVGGKELGSSASKYNLKRTLYRAAALLNYERQHTAGTPRRFQRTGLRPHYPLFRMRRAGMKHVLPDLNCPSECTAYARVSLPFCS